MIHLGVNIDHIATVRQARRTIEPDPVTAAALAELGGADGITVHLRQDRRHIQDRDVRLLRETVQVPLNLEMAVGEDILAIALASKPDQVCLVPEHRQELTTEGGLLVREDDRALRDTIAALRQAGILVSLFIEPDAATVRRALAVGAQAVELHTGTWANVWQACHGLDQDGQLAQQTARVFAAAETAAEIGLRLHAGHGLTYRNVGDLLRLPDLREVNIGHCIVSRAVLVGMERAVREMKAALNSGTER